MSISAFSNWNAQSGGVPFLPSNSQVRPFGQSDGGQQSNWLQSTGLLNRQSGGDSFQPFLPMFSGTLGFPGHSGNWQNGTSQLNGSNGLNVQSFGGMTPPNPSEIFGQIDADGDGSLTQAELDSLPKPPNMPEPPAELKAELLSRIDSNGDGAISEQEFSQATPPPMPPQAIAQGFGNFNGPNGFNPFNRF